METAEELIRTAQIVPLTDRGQEPPCQAATVEGIAADLAERPGGPVFGPQVSSLEEVTAGETLERFFELQSLAMFLINDPAAFAEQDKLKFISMALRAERQFDDSYKTEVDKDLSIQIHGSSERLFI